MPKYTFKCRKCDNKKQIFASMKRVITPCSECGEYMDRQMPILSGPAQVKETVDKLTNKKWVNNQKDIIQDRRDVQYWKIEVPKLVSSGIYEMETMLEMNWVYFDDKKQLHIRTKPPRDN